MLNRAQSSHVFSLMPINKQLTNFLMKYVTRQKAVTMSQSALRQGGRCMHGRGNMLLSFSCSSVRLLHNSLTAWVASIKRPLMNDVTL